MGESKLSKYAFEYRFMPLCSYDEMELVRETAYPDVAPEEGRAGFELWGGGALRAYCAVKR